MELIKSLSNIVTKYFKKKYEIFDFERNRGKTSRQGQMLETLQQYPDITEAELAIHLDVADTQSGRYRTLKTRVRDRLINTLLQIDVVFLAKTERMRAEQEAMRLIRCARLLIGIGMRTAGIQVAHKAIRITRSFNLSLLHLMCLKILRYHYSYVGNRTAFNRYSSELQELTEVVNAELTVDNYLQSMRFEFSREINASDEVRSQALKYIRSARQLTRKIDSFDLQISTFRLTALAMQANGDYRQTISICDEAVAHLKSLHPRFKNRIILQEFELKRMICLFSLRRYQEGLESGQRCLELLGRKRANFLIIYEPILLMHLHLRQYEDALDIYSQVVKDSRFTSALEAHKMRWHIFEAYLRAMAGLGLLTGPPAWNQRAFDIEVFQENVGTLVRNRGGLNISIQIVTVLFYILRRNETEKLDTLHDTIQQFVSRRLRGKSQRRSALFLRMLLSVSACAFDYKKTIQKNRRRLSELKQIGMDFGRNENLEIIPYEVLWQHTLEHLKSDGKV